MAPDCPNQDQNINVTSIRKVTLKLWGLTQVDSSYQGGDSRRFSRDTVAVTGVEHIAWSLAPCRVQDILPLRPRGSHTPVNNQEPLCLRHGVPRCKDVLGAPRVTSLPTFSEQSQSL